MQAIVHAADIQDRDGGVLLMGTLFGLYPFLLKLYADSGYQGPKFQDGLKAACRQVNLEIVKRSDLHRFVVLPKRWVVEVVFTQMTKADVLALGAGRQHVADLGLGVGDDHAIDEQQHELATLLEGGMGQSALHALAERLQRCCHAGKLLLARCVAA